MRAPGDPGLAMPGPPDHDVLTPADVTELRAPFERTGGYTIGVEQELMVLDARTLDLAPRAAELAAAVGAEPWCRTELPAAQIEVATAPASRVGDAVAELADAHATLVSACGGRLRLASGGTHPFACARGVVADEGRYARLADDYGWAAQRALAFGLHVHVAVGGADRTLAVHNALRSWLPLVSALSVNSPFHDGIDTRMASVRPKLCESFPRQGVAPIIPSFEWYAELLAWGARAGAVPDASYHWWETRLHPRCGTLEIRCPDAPGTQHDLAAIVAVVQTLVAWLGDRIDAGEPMPVHDTLRIEENRWRAMRDGVSGELVDLETGRAVPTRGLLAALLGRLAPFALRLGCERELAGAVRLLRLTGAERQRVVASERGLRGLVESMADRFAAEAGPVADRA